MKDIAKSDGLLIPLAGALSTQAFKPQFKQAYSSLHISFVKDSEPTAGSVPQMNLMVPPQAINDMAWKAAGYYDKKYVGEYGTKVTGNETAVIHIVGSYDDLYLVAVAVNNGIYEMIHGRIKKAHSHNSNRIGDVTLEPVRIALVDTIEKQLLEHNIKPREIELMKITMKMISDEGSMTQEFSMPQPNYEDLNSAVVMPSINYNKTGLSGIIFDDSDSLLAWGCDGKTVLLAIRLGAESYVGGVVSKIYENDPHHVIIEVTPESGEVLQILGDVLLDKGTVE